jgi:hypothetical protein
MCKPGCMSRLDQEPVEAADHFSINIIVGMIFKESVIICCLGTIFSEMNAPVLFAI